MMHIVANHCNNIIKCNTVYCTVHVKTSPCFRVSQKFLHWRKLFDDDRIILEIQQSCNASALDKTRADFFIGNIILPILFRNISHLKRSRW